MKILFWQFSFTELLKNALLHPKARIVAYLPRKGMTELHPFHLLFQRIYFSLCQRLQRIIDNGLNLLIRLALVNPKNNFLQKLRRAICSDDKNTQQFLEKISRDQSNNPSGILHVIPGFGAGGAEKQAWLTVKALVAAKSEAVTVLTKKSLSNKKNNFHLDEVDGDLIFDYWEKASNDDIFVQSAILDLGDITANLPADILIDVAVMTKIFRQIKPRVAHIWLSHLHVPMGLAALISGVPRIILAARSQAAIRYSFWPVSHILFYRALLNQNNVQLVTNSYEGAKDHEHWLGLKEQSVKTINNGIETPKDTKGDLIKLPLHWPENAFIIGSIFRFYKVKDPLLWISIAEVVSQEYPHVRFIMGGEGPLLAATTQQVKEKGLEDVFHFTYETKFPLNLMQSFDVFLLTSEREGLPNVLMEAQSVGVPVVAPDVGGCSETFIEGKTGFLVKDRQVFSFFTALSKIIKNTELTASAKKEAPKWIARQFGLQKMIEATYEIYEMEK